MCEDKRSGISIVFANWQGDNCSKNEDEIHDDKYGLKLAHNFGQGRSDEGVTGDSADEDGVNNAIRRHPVTIMGYDDHGQKHQSEAI
jgi:hypothetical protein